MKRGKGDTVELDFYNSADDFVPSDILLGNRPNKKEGKNKFPSFYFQNYRPSRIASNPYI